MIFPKIMSTPPNATHKNGAPPKYGTRKLMPPPKYGSPNDDERMAPPKMMTPQNYDTPQQSIKLLFASPTPLTNLFNESVSSKQLPIFDVQNRQDSNWCHRVLGLVRRAGTKQMIHP